MQQQLLENIEFTEENHIRSLSFSSHFAKFLEGAEKWDGIPKFCVITGPNGSGKSHLLEYANLCLNQKGSDFALRYRHIHLPSNYDNISIQHHDLSTIERLITGEIWNFVKEKTITEELMDSLRDKLVEGYFFHYHNNPKFDQLIDDLKNSANEGDRRLEYKAIEDLIKNYFLYYVTGDASINLLNSVFLSHEAKVVSYMKQSPQAADLIQYALENQDRLFPNRYPDQITMMKDFRNIQDQVQSEYFESKISKYLGESPVKEINDILQKYKFHFEIKQNEDKTEPCKLLLRRTDVQNGPNIRPENLSSGEKKILEILAWYFYYSSHKTYDEKKVRIMLLDEPDRHLDPKLLNVFLKILHDELAGEEKNVQVIMTSHRPDTISLVNNKNIFLLYKVKGTNISKIASVSQRQALYQLTRNLRDMTSIQIKVYTEGTSDADLYCGIYHSLFNVSNQQRLMSQTKLEFHGEENEKCQKDLLSRRYKLLFVPASHNEGKGGGWNQVKLCLKRDQNILKNKEKVKKELTQVLLDTRTYNSLGLVDNDNDQHDVYFQKRNLDKKIAIPKERYSLENFILDPIILCSSWNLHIEEKKTTDNDAQEDNDFNQQNQSLTQQSSEKTKDQKIKEKQERFISICKDIQKELQNIEEEINQNPNLTIDVVPLQSYLDVYFEFLDSMYPIYEKMLVIRKQKREEQKKKKEEAEIKAKAKAEEEAKKSKKQPTTQSNANENDSDAEDHEEELKDLPGGSHKVRVLLLKGSNRMFSVEYPKNFLKIRGHNLAELGFRFIDDSVGKFIGKIASNIYVNGLTFIPEEIADTIFKLNEFAKEQNKEDKSYKN